MSEQHERLAALLRKTRAGGPRSAEVIAICQKLFPEVVVGYATEGAFASARIGWFARGYLFARDEQRHMEREESLT